MNDNQKGPKFSLRSPLTYLAVIVLASFLSISIYAGAQYLAAKKIAQQNLLDNPAKAADNSSLSTDGSVNQLKKTSESFRSIAKRLGPAVVNIKSTKGGPKLKGPGPKMMKRPPGRKRGAPPQMPDEEDGGGMGPQDPFFDFFQRFGHPFNMPEAQGPQTSLGSGIIVDKKGYIVTNNHVVEDASEILVSLPNDKTDLKAKVIGTDPKTDLAVLKVESTKDLPVAEWADSDQVEVGDWAIAIGSPFNLSQTVTLGIVSAKGRNSNVLGGADYVGDLIQTDAAINPGNSGGPLVTLDGQVMGVNTAIYTRSGGYMGIGFAIPSNLAKDVVAKLKKDGKIVRGWLGVYIQPLEPEMAKELGVKDGVSVHEVVPDSPAQKGGLKAGDVIVECDGTAVKEVTQLQRAISGFKPGQTVKMKVVSYSDKKSKNLSVKIGDVPPDEEEAPAKLGQAEEAPDKLGVVVSEVKGKDGVVVQYVQPGSLAEQMGMEPGDVVLSVNRTKVKTPAAYKKAVGSSKRLNLELQRKGRTLFYSFSLPE